MHCLYVYREIVNNHEKENALNIVTDDRTYQVFAESPEDARCGGDFVDNFKHLRHILIYSTCNV